jgi:hypothetical protein
LRPRSRDRFYAKDNCGGHVGLRSLFFSQPPAVLPQIDVTGSCEQPPRTSIWGRCPQGGGGRHHEGVQAHSGREVETASLARPNEPGGPRTSGLVDDSGSVDRGSPAPAQRVLIPPRHEPQGRAGPPAECVARSLCRPSRVRRDHHVCRPDLRTELGAILRQKPTVLV